MKKTVCMTIVSVGIAVSLGACKSNGAASVASSGSTTVSAPAGPAPVPATWRPADKTAEFLGAFRPQE